MNFLINLSKFYLIFGVMGQHSFNYCDMEKTVCHNIPHVGCFQSVPSIRSRSFDLHENDEFDLYYKDITRSYNPLDKLDEELEMLATILTLRKRKDKKTHFCLSSLKFLDIRAENIDNLYLEKFINNLKSFQSIGCDKIQKSKHYKYRLCFYNYTNRSTQVEYDTIMDKHKMLRLRFNINRNDITIMYLVIGLVWFGNLILLIFLYAEHRYETLRFIDRGSSY